ncbi:MAG: RNA polymerase sigma factor [Acidimicrobiia bacterium]|nr:RNA polymerase sigma factor [Acidimicrobiia bacterium]
MLRPSSLDCQSRHERRNFRVSQGSKAGTVGSALAEVTGIANIRVKQARAAGWAEVADREATLLNRCAAGEEAAFAELIAEHQRMVVQLAMNLLGDRDEALDLSQEVFLRVFRTIRKFRGQSALRTWIYCIAVNQARNCHRF